MLNKTRLGSILILLLYSTACNNSKKTINDAADSDKLYQHQWVFTEVQGTVVPLQSQANIIFAANADRRVNGNTGCNNMSGNFEISGGNSIKFSPLGVTKMACADNSLNNLETKILEVMHTTETWRITGDELFFSNGTTVTAKLKGVKPLSDSVKNINGTWELIYVAEVKDPFEKLFPAKKPTVIFNLPNPEISGFGGCNGYSSLVKIDGNNINFGDPLSTMMACEGGGEPYFFSTLKKITSYKIVNGNTLVLLMGTAELLRFTKK